MPNFWIRNTVSLPPWKCWHLHERGGWMKKLTARRWERNTRKQIQLLQDCIRVYWHGV